MHEFPSVIDSTIRSAYVSCPKKFYWEYIRNLRRSDTSIHLHFGGTFAAGLEAFRLAFYGKKLTLEEAELYAVRKILARWGDYEDPTDSPKTLERCIFGLQAYIREYPPHTDPIQPFYTADGSPAVEFSFALPLDINHPETGEPLLYAGRFDLLGEYNQHLWAVDEKTTSRLGPSWMKQWEMRGQLLGYVKAAQSYGLTVAGAIVRGMSVLKSDYGFAQVILPIQQWKVDEWWEQLHVDISNMVADWHMHRYSKAFGDACSAYSGCSYIPLCNTPNPERWVPQYHVIKWNPVTGTATAQDSDPEDKYHSKDWKDQMIQDQGLEG